MPKDFKSPVGAVVKGTKIMTPSTDPVQICRVAADRVRALRLVLENEQAPGTRLSAGQIRDVIGEVSALIEHLPQIFDGVGASAFDAYGGAQSGLDELAAATRATIWLVRAGDDADRLRHDLGQAFLAADQLSRTSARPLLRPVRG